MQSLWVGIDPRPTEIRTLLSRWQRARVRAALCADTPPASCDTGSSTAALVGNGGPLFVVTLAARRQRRRRDGRCQSDDRDFAQLLLVGAAR